MDSHKSLNRLSTAGVLISLGIVFGDIGTSPLYVMKAIIGEGKPIHRDVVLGGISAVFWTLTFMTTLKYVFLTLRADNKGEGGILSLYALVRRYAKWLVFPAMIGGASLLADGIITPPISVTSAIEGLKTLYPSLQVVPIVIGILSGLFLLQRYGTTVVGRFFGPIMIVWFGMLAYFGISEIAGNFEVLAAINPKYVVKLLAEPGGFWFLGAVFLCTTGAEALYSDLGHCGRKNIQTSWLLVKIALLLNYFGQGAYLLKHEGAILDFNPFYSLMPKEFLIYGVIIATMAAIIASQALISGSYTLIGEAVRMNLWPKIRVMYPNTQKGQIYIPSLNILLYLGCVAMSLHFQDSHKMEAAYGLAITITMLMTTTLLAFYMKFSRFPMAVVVLATIVFLTVEIAFLVANLKKFPEGGYITLIISVSIAVIMGTWYRARQIKNQYTEFTELDTYLPMMRELSEDTSIQKFATNLVFLTSADRPREIERKIMYSIFNKQPKRADLYWFVHIDVVDDPRTMGYTVEDLIPGKVIKVNFRLGFRVAPKINTFFRKVVEDLSKSGEVNVKSRYKCLAKYDIVGDFRFVVIDRVLNFDTLPLHERLVLSLYKVLKFVSLSEEKAFGLDTSNVMTEKVPLIPFQGEDLPMQRMGNIPETPVV